MSHNSHPPGSPLSPLSPPTAMLGDQKTIYDVIYSKDNPAEFYGNAQLTTTGACPHLVRLKQKLKLDGASEDNVLENYRSLVKYSLLWHKTRKSKAEGKKRKLSKQVTLLKLQQMYIHLTPCKLISSQKSFLYLNVVLAWILYHVYMLVFIVFISVVGKRDI